MLVGVLEMDLYLPSCNSLKEKRYVMKSLKDKMKSRFNISVAETDSQDLWQRSTLVVAVIATSGSRANSLLSKVVKFVEEDRRLQLLDYRLKFL